MYKKVIVIGASGHGRVISDIVRRSGDQVLGFLDDREAKLFTDINVLGKVTDAEHFMDEAEFIIGVGDNETRERVASRLATLSFYTAIHPSAVISEDVSVGAGSAIMANVVINTGTQVGKHCIINTAATVDHDNTIKDFVHLSPGVHTAGTVFIGERTWLGIGAIVSNNLKICSGCVIGAGSVVVKNITETGTYLGMPARKIQ